MVYNQFLVGSQIRPKAKLDTYPVYEQPVKGIANNSIRNDFQRFYIAEEEKSHAFDQSVVCLMTENPSALVRVLRINKTKLRTTNTNIELLINYFGSADVADNIKMAQLSKLKTDDDIKSVKVNGNSISIEKIDGTIIQSEILSTSFDWLKHDEDLKSSIRVGKGKKMSVLIARCIDSPCKVVTGQISGITKNSKYLRTWVETKIDGKDVVIDYEMNAIMNKEGYYALRQAKEISRIYQTDLDDDIELITPSLKNKTLSLDEYLVYRDRVMETFRTNSND